MLVLVSFSSFFKFVFRMIGVRYLITICEKGSISLVILYSVSLRHVSYFMDGLCIQPLILAVIRRGVGENSPLLF